jgi:citrate lyase beta subunit
MTGAALRRQPVHTVYGGAHLFRANTSRRLGELALRSLGEYAPDASTFASAIGIEDAALAEQVYARVVEKLEREPVEDFRLDFEDGYGYRPDKEEDATAVGSAREVARGLADGTLPHFVGIRVKPLSPQAEPRALRTLDRFLTTLIAETGGLLPADFVVTNPKIVEPGQVARLADALDRLESKLGLAANSVPIELMIETPRSVIDARGRIALPALVEAARGRCIAAHFGVYDYTALLGITARHQDLDHPACDFARHVMQVALEDTGVWICDGATNVLPAPPHRPAMGGSLTSRQERENREVVHHGWALHYRHVRHSLRHGYYQGWDLHPAQLPTRYAAVFAFYLEALDAATERLRRFVEQAARATLTGDVFDDAATGQALLNFFLRGLGCGAITEEEAGDTGLTLDELRTRSFSTILEGRAKVPQLPR